MELIRDFKKISKEDANLAGGKGASLGEMIMAGVPVPQGFVVLSSAFVRFLEETDLNVEIDAILHKVNHQEIHTVDKASEQIQELIMSVKMPKDIEKEIKSSFKKLGAKYVAVRSSATAEDSLSASWAGQLDTFLNTTEKDLIKNIQKCFASLFTPRAIFYRFEKKLHKTMISVAVVVQEMVESEVSGIAFSVHPVTEDKNQLIIEAGFGLGEAIVSGQITPDSYVVEKAPLRIIDKNISEQARWLIRANKRIDEKSKTGFAPRNSSVGGNVWTDLPKEKGESQKLSDKQILELSELILKIEKHYGFPCDIEWAFSDGKFYITQSRPITTLKSQTVEHSAPETTGAVESFKLVNSQNYDFLWTVGFPYLYCSMYLESGYHKLDFIACNNGRSHTLFVSKKEREKLSKKGLRLYTVGFQRYLEHITLRQVFIKKQLGIIFKQDLTKLSNKQFAKSFLKTVRFCISMWKDYFPLEYHSSDLVSKILAEQNSSFDLKQLRKNTDRMGKIKFLQRKQLNKTFYSPSIFYKYISEIEHRLSLKWDIQNYSYYEIVDALDGKELGEIPDRSGFVIRGLFSGYRDVVGEKAKHMFEQLQKFDANAKEFSGSIANKGFYRGKIKIIHFSVDTDFNKEIETMKKGDVLVSGSTGPEMILACKKARAIITDEGGVISHAAIVSRELKKPCIIGTKIATKVLKDGDLVEVDAERGVVKILSRTKNV